jgi:penicillin-binding protein 1A
LNILEGAIIRGTGKSLKEINYPIAGKTGTTNDSKDLWFFGLTPEMVVGIYVGYDKPKKIGYKETGSSVALPVFKKFIKSYLNSNKVDLRAEFNIPQGVIKKYVDINDGSIFNKYNSNLIEDYFTQEQLTIIDKNDIQGIN